MSIKQKIKSVWDKVARKHDDCGDGCGCGCNGKKRKRGCDDAELGAEQVIEKEIYPDKPVKKACGNGARNTKACKSSGTRKPPSKRTRPTTDNYEMIDKDDNTCDSGKS